MSADKSLGFKGVLVTLVSHTTVLNSNVEYYEVMERPDGSVYVRFKPTMVLVASTGPTWTYTTTIDIR